MTTQQIAEQIFYIGANHSPTRCVTAVLMVSGIALFIKASMYMLELKGFPFAVKYMFDKLMMTGSLLLLAILMIASPMLFYYSTDSLLGLNQYGLVFDILAFKPVYQQAWLSELKLSLKYIDEVVAISLLIYGSYLLLKQPILARIYQARALLCVGLGTFMISTAQSIL